MTKRPTRQASTIECLNTKRRIVLSCPNQLVAVEATTIDCASIILPITPPDELAAAIRIGDRPSCSRGDLLQIAEQDVRSGIRSRQRDAQPAEQRAEEGIEHAGRGEGETERRVDAGEPGQRADRQHRRDRDQRIAHRPDGAAVFRDHLARRQAHEKPEMIAAISMPVPVNDR